MEYKFDSYCGLYCGACDLLRANINNELEEMVKDHNNSVENFTCYGCKTEKVAEWCAKCKIRICARERKVDFCLDCQKFPCNDWREFSENPQFIQFHKEALSNMQTIKDDGLDYWLKQQSLKWRCKNCNESIAWTDKKCKKCNSEIA